MIYFYAITKLAPSIPRRGTFTEWFPFGGWSEVSIYITDTADV
jgi:hypothetical protein